VDVAVMLKRAWMFKDFAALVTGVLAHAIRPN
jgi:hypothetical protein